MHYLPVGSARRNLSPSPRKNLLAGQYWTFTPILKDTGMAGENRWDEKAGLRRDAVGSQIIDVLEAQEIKETGNEEG